MSKILVLGASGYLGNNVANRLVESGQHTVLGSSSAPSHMSVRKIIVCTQLVEMPCPSRYEFLFRGLRLGCNLHHCLPEELRQTVLERLLAWVPHSNQD
jgi:hypothetical protein